MRKISLIIMLALISSLTFAQPRQRAHEMRPRLMRGIEGLNLTGEQRDAISDLKFESEQKRINLTAELQKNRLEIDKMFEDNNVDEDDVRKLHEKNNSIKAQLANMRLEMRLSINELLTDEQKAELRNMRKGLCRNGIGGKNGMRNRKHGRLY